MKSESNFAPEQLMAEINAALDETAANHPAWPLTKSTVALLTRCRAALADHAPVIEPLPGGPVPYTDGEGNRQICIGRVVETVEVRRLPTERMLEAGRRANVMGKTKTEVVYDIWRAMCDACEKQRG